MNKFIIALDEGTAVRRNAITSALMEKDWGMCHRVEDFWMLAGVPDDVTPQSIYNELNEKVKLGTKSIIVIKIPPNGQMTYFGMAQQDCWKWMERDWGTAE